MIGKHANTFLGWVAFTVYAIVLIGGTIYLVLHPLGQRFWNIGMLVVLGYGGVIYLVFFGNILKESQDLMQVSDWMRKGGLMEAPTGAFSPDADRIRVALAAFPADGDRDIPQKVEAYLAMPTGEEQQLRRDQIIRELYQRAVTSHEDLAHRTAYSELRRALSPWTDETGD